VLNFFWRRREASAPFGLVFICVLTAVRAPNMNAIAERLVKTIKDECLSKMAFFGEGMLRCAIADRHVQHHGLTQAGLYREPRIERAAPEWRPSESRTQEANSPIRLATISSSRQLRSSIDPMQPHLVGRKIIA
jgi:hypothetical protein